MKKGLRHAIHLGTEPKFSGVIVVVHYQCYSVSIQSECKNEKEVLHLKNV